MLKKTLFVLVLMTLIFSFSCQSTWKSTVPKDEVKEGDSIHIKNDSLSYEIIIVEPGFQGWLVSQRPRGFYEQAFLENKNIQYVNAYNARVINRANTNERELYPLLIDYNGSIDYGYEVNYLLYHYFVYFEEKYNQKLRP